MKRALANRIIFIVECRAHAFSFADGDVLFASVPYVVQSSVSLWVWAHLKFSCILFPVLLYHARWPWSILLDTYIGVDGGWRFGWRTRFCRTGQCLADTTLGKYGRFVWPLTDHSHVAALSCPHDGDGDNPKAFRRCSVVGAAVLWQLPDYSQCKEVKIAAFRVDVLLYRGLSIIMI